MKEKIIQLAKKYNLNIKIIADRIAFDIINYEIYIKDDFIDVFTYYTGKTSNGLEYPSDDILIEIERKFKELYFK